MSIDAALFGLGFILIGLAAAAKPLGSSPIVVNALGTAGLTILIYVFVIKKFMAIDDSDDDE